ncbi:murein biosynthesis integral membrane protein MurJ [Aquabacterium sp. OR-4]|uniref:murein biosynthesis integral membrane protein MurJ n=1 Tax=Aquabacterium sp. OR-4 TaxID=2978127 RepID=UPI0021B23811|nr:murein biosynthesis integral membrane protein MurJ [Aquabacterium sp. OR-4]MDT7835794.1 murein biosynthesis integral membrane protein MurJ [Aquabacterium sp. OR-4]
MNLYKAVFSVSALTLLSRITGLVREQIGAALFGTSAMMDAFQIAFRIPNLLRRLFAEGAFSQAFVPLLAATRATDGDEATRDLVDAVATVLAWALVLTCLAGIAAAPLLVWLLASGFTPDTEATATAMTRWMFPYIGCMSMVALASGVLNTWKRFAVPAFTPVLLNVSVIAAALLGVPLLRARGIEPVYALAVGVMLGGVLQLALQVPALARIGMLPRLGLTLGRLRRAWHHPGVRRILAKMAPALLGVSVAQLSLMINSQIASYLGVGAVSSLVYADRLMELPTALLGVALGVVLTPQLSTAKAQGDSAAYSSLLDWGLRLVLLLALPCAVALLLFAQPMVAVLFHRGAFDAQAVHTTTLAVMGYGAGVIGLVGVKVAAGAYFAQQDMATPMRVAIVALVLTQVFNAVFIWGAGMGVAALALSIGLAANANAGLLLLGLRRRGSYVPAAGWAMLALRVVLGSAVMAVWMWLLARHIDWLALGSNEALRAAAMAAALASAAVIYFGVLHLTGIRLRSFLRKS